MDINALSIPSRFCRTCLVELGNSTTFYDADYMQDISKITIKQKLNNCIPELDLNIIPETIICGDCYDSINAMHKFKIKCLKAEMHLCKSSQQLDQASRIINPIETTQFSQSQNTNSDSNFKREDLETTEKIKNEELTTNFDANVLNENDTDMEDAEPQHLLPFEMVIIEDGNFNINEEYSPYLVQPMVNFPQNNALIDHDYSLNYNLGMYIQEGIENKSFTCILCKTRFKNKNVAYFHASCHRKEPQYKCLYCQYQSNLRNVKMHMRDHTEGKQYKCLYCEHACNNKRKLQSHIQIHKE